MARSRSDRPAGSAAAIPDYFEGTTTVPEVSAAQLDARVIMSAIRHHGGLVVRGLMPPELCESCGRTSITAGKPSSASVDGTRDPAWFDPIDTDAYGLTMMARPSSWPAARRTSPTLLASSSISSRRSRPRGEAHRHRLLRRTARALPRQARAAATGAARLGRLAPGRRGVRHVRADAERLGAGLALRRRRARLEMFPRPLDHLVSTYGTEGVDEYRALVDDVAVLTAEVPPARPVFEAGDAAIFDQFLLHQTAASPTSASGATASSRGSSRRRRTRIRSAGSRSSIDERCRRPFNRMHCQNEEPAQRLRIAPRHHTRRTCHVLRHS